jgi:outer membrane protein assembly factor BamB
MAGGGPRNRSAVDATLPAAVTEAWRADIGGWPTTPPVVADETVYVGTGRRYRAFTAGDGTQVWETSLPSRDGAGVAPTEVAGSPAVATSAGVLVATTHEGGWERRGGTVVAFDAATGDRVWDRVPDGRYAYSVRVADGTAYLRTSSECLALSAADGRVQWRHGGLEPLAYDRFNIHEPYGVGAAPAVADRTVYLPAENRLRTLSAATGEERWSVDLPYCLSAPAVVNDRVYARGYSSESRTVALTPGGREMWRTAVGGLAAPAATEERVFVVDGDIVALEAATGEEQWRWDLRTDIVRASPVATERAVIALGTRSAALRRERPRFGTGARVLWELPGEITETVPSAVGAGHLYAVDPFAGQLVAYTGR